MQLEVLQSEERNIKVPSEFPYTRALTVARKIKKTFGHVRTVQLKISLQSRAELARLFAYVRCDVSHFSSSA